MTLNTAKFSFSEKMKSSLLYDGYRSSAGLTNVQDCLFFPSNSEWLGCILTEWIVGHGTKKHELVRKN